MKKLELVVLILTVIMLSGCTVRSTITVRPDKTVTEEVKVLDDNENYTGTYSIREQISSTLEQYSGVLDFRKYSHDYEIGDKKSGAKIKKDYDNICSYFKDTAFNQYVYKSIDCTEDDYYYEIRNKTEYIPYCEECSDWPRLDEVTLTIKLPVKAEASNADSVNNNEYIWNFGKDAPDNKELYLKISKTALEEKQTQLENEENTKKNINIVITVLVVLAVTVIIGLIGLVLYKKYQRTKIEY